MLASAWNQRRTIYVLAGCLLVLPLAAHAAEPVFRDRTEAVGLSGVHESLGLYGPGVSAVDFDLDGDLDLFVCNDVDGNRLYRNDGGVLIDVAPALGLNYRAELPPLEERTYVNEPDATSMMPSFVDVDNDGDRDLFVTMWNTWSRFYRNDGQGAFVDETDQSDLRLVEHSASAAFADYDNNNFLDVYVSTWGHKDQLYRSAAQGTGFGIAGSQTGIWDVPNNERPGWCALWYFHDDDRSMDLLVGNDFGFPNFAFWNLGSSFLPRENQWFTLEHNMSASMGMTLGDFDHDGDDDLYVTNTPVNDFYERRGDIFVSLNGTGDPIVRPMKDPNISWFCSWLDVDNDGWLDLFVVDGYIPTCAPGIPDFPHNCGGTTEQANRLWMNAGGTFVDKGVSAGLDDTNFGRAAAVSDFDLDGDLDLFITNNNGPYRYLRNDTLSDGHWLTIRLEGVVGNRDGIGARIRATAGDYTHRRTHLASSGYLSQPSDEIHIGLGAEDTVTRLQIIWPAGTVDEFEMVGANQRLTIREGAASELTVLPTQPAVTAETVATGLRLNVELAAEEEWERVTVHRARPGLWSGVVHSEDFESSKLSFEWTDPDVVAGDELRYRVSAWARGVEVMSDQLVAVVDTLAIEPTPNYAVARVRKNLPNPFNPSTVLQMELPGQGVVSVTVSIFDSTGRLVRELYRGHRDAGEWELPFDGRADDGSELASGVYYARLQVDGSSSASHKLTLLR